MLIVTFLMFVWTTSCWFTQGMAHPFLGLPFLSMNVLFPFIALITWSVISGSMWFFRNGKVASKKTKAWYQSNRRTAISLALIVLFYLLLQIPAIVMYRAVNDSDSAHYGVASYHIADGKERPMWFYGKHYNGTFSPHAAALFHLVFGKNPAHLRLVNSLQYLGFLLFLFVIVRRLSDDRTALLAAALAAVPPFLINQFINNTYFASVMFFGAWGFYLLIRLLDKERPMWRDYSWVGAMFGFGFFTHLQLVFFVITAFVLLFVRDKLVFFRLRFWTFIPGLLLGSLPTVIDSYYYDFIIFRRFFSQAAKPRQLLSGFIDGAGEFFRHVPELLGANQYLGLPGGLTSLLMPLVMLFVVVTILVVIIQNWQILLNILRFRNEKPGLLAFVLYIAVLFLLFAASSQSTPPSPARYTAPVWFALIPIIAAALISLPRKLHLRAGAIALTFLLFASSHLSFDLLATEREGRLAAWEQFMRKRGITHYFGDFWTTYLGNFITREEIIGTCVPDLFEAYPPYYISVANDPKPTVYHFRSRDRRYGRVKRWLGYVGVTYDQVDSPFGFFLMNLSQRATIAQLYGLVEKPYKATIENVTSREIINDDGTPMSDQLLTITIRNSGEAEWLPRIRGGIVEAVVVDNKGDVLRRHHLEGSIEPGATTTIRTILSQKEFKRGNLLLQVRVNDIYFTNEPLSAFFDSTEDRDSTIAADKIVATSQRELLAEDFSFFQGWLHWVTDSGNLMRYAVDGRSSIGIFLEKPQTLEIDLVLASFHYEGEARSVDISYAFNGKPLDIDGMLEQSQRVSIRIPENFVNPGLNVLTMTYDPVEPVYDRRENYNAIFRHRRRAFSIDKMNVTAIDPHETEEAGR